MEAEVAMTKVSMSVQDALWLTMDRPNNLMVVDGAMVLSEQVSLDRVTAVYIDALSQFPVFQRRAVPSGMGWAWEDDPHFSIDRHISEVTLPQPAGMTELQNFVAAQRTAPLPRTGPSGRPSSWTRSTCRTAPPIRGRQPVPPRDRRRRAAHPGDVGAVTSPIPQSRSRWPNLRPTLMPWTWSAASPTPPAPPPRRREGRRAVGQGRRLRRSPCSDPSGRCADRPPAAGGRVPRRCSHGVEDGVQFLRHPDHLLDALDAMGVESTRGTHDLTSVTKDRTGRQRQDGVDRKAGTRKAIAWSRPIPLPDIKNIGRAGSATVNDVLLAAIAGGLRQYLLEHDAFIDEVNWMVPVNLKPFADNLPPDLGNYFALVFLPMPLDAADPRERLVQMHQRMDRIKHPMKRF